MGSRVSLRAAADGFSIGPAGSHAGSSSSNGKAPGASSNGNGNGNGNGAARPAAAPAQKVGSITVLPLQEASAATCGAKAAACGELLRVASHCSAAAASAASAAASNGGASGTSILAAADGVVLPFGCMEAALAAEGQQGRFEELLRTLRSQLGSMQPGSAGGAGSLAALDGVCGDIQGLLQGLRIPQQVRLGGHGSGRVLCVKNGARLSCGAPLHGHPEAMARAERAFCAPHPSPEAVPREVIAGLLVRPPGCRCCSSCRGRSSPAPP